MKVSSINVVLTEEDIMSFVTDFLAGEDFYIDKIMLKEGIEVKGRFKKGITISFLIYININKVEENKLYVDIKKIKILKLPIFKFVINRLMKIAINELEDLQVHVEDNMAVIDVGRILEDSKGFKIDIENIVMDNGQVTVSTKNLFVDINNNFVQASEDESIEEKYSEDNKGNSEENIKQDEENLPITVEQTTLKEKKQDIYSVGRQVILEKMPEKLKPYSEYIMILPDLTALIGRILMDNRVATKTKIMVTATIGYVLVPGDLIDDKIPLIGSIDDLGMIFFAINRIVNDVPLNIILENWDGDDEIVLILKKALEYLSKYTTAGKLEKLYSVIETLS